MLMDFIFACIIGVMFVLISHVSRDLAIGLLVTGIVFHIFNILNQLTVIKKRLS